MTSQLSETMASFINIFIITLTFISTSNRHRAYAYLAELDQCEPIKIPRCRSMPYDMTLMPNFVHHSSQENARLVFEKFEFILDTHCSDVLLFLLCSIYVPICPVSLQPENIPPCRSVCNKAREGCEPLLHKYNATWPAAMECSRFPEYERGVCITPDAFVRPNKSKRGCRCKKRRPSLRNFMKYKYNYAFHFHVQKRKRGKDGEIAYKGKLVQVIFSNHRKIKLTSNNVDVTVYSNTSRCACSHKLRKGQDYVIMANRAKDVTKFVLDKHSAVEKWKRTWPIRIKKWHTRIRTRILRQKHQKKFSKDRHNPRWKVNLDPSVLATSQDASTTTNRRTNALPITDFVDGYTHGGRYYPKSKSSSSKSKRYRLRKKTSTT